MNDIIKAAEAVYESLMDRADLYRERYEEVPNQSSLSAYETMKTAAYGASLVLMEIRRVAAAEPEVLTVQSVTEMPQLPQK